MTLTCPTCRQQLRVRFRLPQVVSCRCGLQMLVRDHPRRAGRIACTRLDTEADITRAWQFIRGQHGLEDG